MTPTRRLHIVSLVTSYKKLRDRHREGVPWDGRVRTDYATRDLPAADREMMQAAYNATRELIERDREC